MATTSATCNHRPGQCGVCGKGPCWWPLPKISGVDGLDLVLADTAPAWKERALAAEAQLSTLQADLECSETRAANYAKAIDRMEGEIAALQAKVEALTALLRTRGA